MPNQIKKMLLAVDGSPRAMSTVRYTARMLRPGQAQVVLLGVINTLHEVIQDLSLDPAMRDRLKGARAWAARQRRDLESFMARARAEFRRQGHPKELLRLKIKESSRGASAEIVREAANSYHTAVLGRRGRKILRGLSLGGTASKLIMHITEQPLWVVGKGANPNRMLLAVDSSPSSRRVVDYVAEMAGGSELGITLFQVICEGDGILPSRSLLESSQSELAQLAGRFAKFGLDPASIQICVTTDPTSRAAAIVREARRGEYGTIVLGRRGSSPGDEFPMGRVANKVLHLSRGLAVWLVN